MPIPFQLSAEASLRGDAGSLTGAATLNESVMEEVAWASNESTTSPMASDCYHFIRRNDPDADYCKNFNFAFNGVLIGSLCVAGLAGNIVSLMVLQRDRCNRVAGLLLQALAVADCTVLVISLVACTLFTGFIPYFPTSAGIVPMLRPYMVKFVQPLAYMSQTATIWTTVLLSINRYIGICKPFDAPVWCTTQRAKAQIIAVAIFAIGFNFPRFFQYQLVRNSCHRTIAVATSIGEREKFGIVYTNALYSVVVLLLPLAILLVLNIRVIYELQAHKNRRHSLVVGQISAATPMSSREEKGITLVMVIVIVVFLICHTPDRVVQLVKNFLTNDPGQCNTMSFYLTNACNLLIVFNSSCNFLIYYVFRKRFRSILLLQLCASVKMWRREKEEGDAQYSALTPTMAVRGNGRLPCTAV